MSKGWERFFFILAYVSMGSSYMSPRNYAILHRLHHAYTDTEMDPHSPAYSSNVFSMMWRTLMIFRKIRQGKIPVEARFTKNLPEWKSFDRFASSDFSNILWATGYTLFFVKYATSPWQYLLLPICIGMGAFHGAVINWFAHKYGYINFKMKNTSMNLLFVDFLMLGESYHNNHHKHPSSVNFGHRWHEIDPIYPIIRLFNWLGIIKIRKAAEAAVISDGLPHSYNAGIPTRAHVHEHEHAH